MLLLRTDFWRIRNNNDIFLIHRNETTYLETCRKLSGTSIGRPCPRPLSDQKLRDSALATLTCCEPLFAYLLVGFRFFLEARCPVQQL